MITATILLALFALAPFAWLYLDETLADRQDAHRREQQERPVDDEWLAVLAATDEPIFAELWAESLRRDLEEWA